MLFPYKDEKLYQGKSPRSWLLSFWKRINTIKQFTRWTQSRSKNGNECTGRGEVFLSTPTDTTLMFHERGSWQMKEGQNIDFSNTFRWTFYCTTSQVSLEHLRFGLNRPIFLFHLIPTDHHLLASVDSHRCKNDVYIATVLWDHQSIWLNWRIIGPKKNEEIQCYYT